MLAPLSEQWDLDLRSRDPLAFPGYAAKLAALDLPQHPEQLANSARPSRDRVTARGRVA